MKIFALALLALLTLALPAKAQDAGWACTLTLPINTTSSVDLYTSTNKLHICAVVLVNSTASTTMTLEEGTGSTCGSNTKAMIGGTITTGTGGVISAVAGEPWLHTAVKGDHLCLILSASTQVSGVITASDR